LFISFDMLYFSTDGCINKSLTYLLTYLDSVCLLGYNPLTVCHAK